MKTTICKKPSAQKRDMLTMDTMDKKNSWNRTCYGYTNAYKIFFF